MFVAIEFSYEYNYNNDSLESSVSNVYGPFKTLEEAEEFRKTHKNKEDVDCFLLISPEDA